MLAPGGRISGGMCRIGVKPYKLMNDFLQEQSRTAAYDIAGGIRYFSGKGGNSMKGTRKRGVVFILTLVMALSVITPAAAAPENDIDAHWAAAYIYQAVRGGFADMHDGRFEPDRAVTRAEFAHMMTAMLGLSRVGDSTFTDVEKDSPYDKDIQAAVAAGILKGKETGKFYPDGEITRQEAGAIISRVVPSADMLDQSCLDTFHDVKEIASWAREPLANL